MQCRHPRRALRGSAERIQKRLPGLGRQVPRRRVGERVDRPLELSDVLLAAVAPAQVLDHVLLGGVTEKMLIQQLREMEADGLVRREVFPEVPPRVEYSTTPAGAELYKALGPIAEWGQKYAAAKEASRDHGISTNL